MPSNIDKKFIDNLQTFTESLENVVELLKEQSKSGDAVNQMLSTMDGTKIEDISKGIKEILEVSKETNDNTKKILEEIKASRKQKENGMFDKIEGKDNKRKIVDGITTVMLIAGGVLAIGLAFKIVGEVDFLSVIALSLGILAVSYAFAEVAKIKELTLGKTLMVGLAFVVMATSITISSLILKNFAPIEAKQLFSFTLVGAALGVASFFIFKSMKDLDIKVKDVWKYLLLPVLLPAIAAGIVLSSWFLKDTASIGLMQAVSAIFVGAALVVGSIAVAMIIKSLSKSGKIDPLSIGLALLIIPGIAAGIVGASWIFTKFVPISDPIALLISSLAIGVSLLAFLPAVYILGKMKAKDMLSGLIGAAILSHIIVETSKTLNKGIYDGKYPEWKWSLGVGLSLISFLPAVYVLGKMRTGDMISGLIGATLISLVIVATSHILNEGKYDGKYPDWKWSLGVGLALISFLPAVYVLGKMSVKDMLAGSLGTVIVSVAIMVSSHILSIGNYGNYPDWKWALGVGLSLIMFLPAVVVLGIVAMSGVGALVILAGAGMTLVMAASIMAVSHILKAGDYGSYPSAGWAAGVGLSLIIFSTGAIILGVLGPLALIGLFFIKRVSKSIVDVSEILGSGKYINNYPSVEWAAGVGLSLTSFTKTASEMNIEDIAKVALTFPALASSIVDISNILKSGSFNDEYPSETWINGVKGTLITFNDLGSSISIGGLLKTVFGLPKIAEAIVEISNILSKGNFSGGPDGNWITNLNNLFSIVDKVPTKDKLKRLEDFISVLKDFSKAADKLNSSGLEKLGNLTASVTVLSVIDDQRLRSVINVLGSSKDNLSNAVDKGMSSVDLVKQTSTQVQKVDANPFSNEKSSQDLMIEKFDTVIKKFDELLEYVIQGKGAEATGRKDNVK